MTTRRDGVEAATQVGYLDVVRPDGPCWCSGCGAVIGEIKDGRTTIREVHQPKDCAKVRACMNPLTGGGEEMSADNFLFVGKADGRYFVEQRFASDDDAVEEAPSGRNPTWFDGAIEAIIAAHAREAEGYYEYGVRLAGGVLVDSL